MRIPVENVKTLKTWLWVFSATDNLRNVNFHHMDYGPNMSLWDDYSQNRSKKVFSENERFSQGGELSKSGKL